MELAGLSGSIGVDEGLRTMRTFAGPQAHKLLADLHTDYFFLGRLAG